MRCEHIEIVNFCQFQYHEETFAPGLSAIIGPNGRGKSNFLGAIRFALTGENPNVGTKLANICAMSEARAPSYVKLTFSHGDVRGAVQRNLRPSRPTAVLTLEGGDTIEGDTAVTARINDLLGVDNDIINDIMIVAQDDIFGFLDKTPGKRAEQFQRLFHTEKAAEVHKVIGDQMKTVEVPAVGVDLDELRINIRQAEEALHTHDDQLGRLPAYDEITKQRDANAEVVRKYDQRASLEGQMRTVAATKAAEETTRGTINAQLLEAQQQVETIRQARDGHAESAATAQQTLAQLGSWRQTNAARDRQVQEIAQVDTLIEQLREPVEPENFNPQPETTRGRFDQLQAERHQHVTFVESFDGEVAACPTCGTPTTDLENALQMARERIPVIEAELDQITTVVNASTVYIGQKNQYDQNLQSLRERRQRAQDTLASLGEEKDTNVDEEGLAAVVNAQRTYDEGLSEMQPQVARIESELARLDGRIESMGDQIAGFETQIAALPAYTEEQRRQANENVVGWERTQTQRRELEQQRAVTSTTLTQTQQQLATNEQIEAQGRVLRSWLDFATEMRGVVHKDAAPKFVAQRNLLRLQVQTNEGLRMFQTDFQVSASEGLSFTAHFHGGPSRGTQQPAERLSGGQKTVLALSFRLALNLMFAENVGALYLDEPTAYLDEHHIRGFEPVLAQLREFSAARGLQCFIITHERDLAPLFDSVIQL